MKKTVYLSLIFFISLFISCKNSTAIKLAYTDIETVKETVINKENEITWTKELEGDRLSKELNNQEFNNEDIQQNPDLLKINSQYQQPVYPEFEGFGKLDTRNINNSLYEKIDGFCELVSNNFYGSFDSFLNPKYRFNFVFFREDFVSNYAVNFGKDFPTTKEMVDEYNKAKIKKEEIENSIKQIKTLQEQYDEQQKELLEKEEKEKEDNEEEVPREEETLIEEKTILENKEKLPELEEQLKEAEKEFNKNQLPQVFNKWIFGEPFIGEEITQIPVRFYCKQGSVDVTLYLNSETNLIYQITINRWEKV